jgi:hypothetical protein
VQLAFEECSDPRARAAAGTLARIALRRGQPLLAQAWLSEAGTDGALRREVTSAVAALPAAAGIGGEYRRYQRGGLWNTVAVTPQGSDRLHFNLDAFRVSGGWCSDMQAFAAGDHSSVVGPLGGMEGDAVRKGEAFVYETRAFADEDQEPCVMTFRFRGDALTLTQDGSDVRCGFGGGVDAGGEYARTAR